MKKLFPMMFGICLGAAVFLMMLSLSFGMTTAQNTSTTTPIFTEAAGGVLDGDDLRCPVNLSGVGPAWRNIQVGISTFSDWQEQFAPYAAKIVQITPYPHTGVSTPTLFEGDFAPYYRASAGNYSSERDLPGIFGACVVDGKIAAFFISTEHVTDVPRHIDEYISLLGAPDHLSWNVLDQYWRLIHWSHLGVSVSVNGERRVNTIFYYPYQSGNERWPMNALLEERKFALFPNETIELEQFDQVRMIGLDDIVGTVAADPVYPTRTPNASLDNRGENSTDRSTLTPIINQSVIPERPENLVDIQRLLKQADESCQLPCFWGFIPGHTTEEEVIEFVQPVAIGNNAPDLIYALMHPSKNEPIFSLSFGTTQSIVSTIYVLLKNPSKWMPRQTFELSHFLTGMPHPAYAYLSINITTQRIFLTLAYEAGIYARYTFDLQFTEESLPETDFRFCPSLEFNSDIWFELRDSNIEEVLESYGYPVYLAKNKIWTVEHMTEMTTEAFIRQIVDHPGECIELPSYAELNKMGYEF